MTNIEYLTVSIDISITGVEAAVAQHLKATETFPTTLVCGLEDVIRAYEVLQSPGMQRMIIVPVPGMLAHAWFVCSPNYVVFGGYA